MPFSITVLCVHLQKFEAISLLLLLVSRGKNSTQLIGTNIEGYEAV